MDKQISIDYCKALKEYFRNIDCLSFPGSKIYTKMDMDKLYVPIKISSVGIDWKILTGEKSYIPHILIKGEPGSGKTICLKYRIRYMANDCLTNDDIRIPIPIMDGSKFKNIDEWLKEFQIFVKKELKLKNFIDDIKELKEYIFSENCILMIDNIEAIPSSIIENIIKEYDIVIEGTAGMNYHNDSIQIEEEIKPFDLKQIKQYINKWFECQWEYNQREKGERIETLIAHIKADKKLFNLCKNPLLLSYICMIHYNLHRLPDSKEKLYDRILDIIACFWWEKYKDTIPSNPKNKLKRLKYMAKNSIVYDEDILKFLTESILTEHAYTGKEKEARLEAQNFVHYLKTRTNLIIKDKFSSCNYWIDNGLRDHLIRSENE